MLAPGDVLANRYRVIKRLGRGGMAVVYQVWDTQRSTPLALKLLLSDNIQTAGIKQFRREAEALKTLSHPEIVRFYEVAEDRDKLFILMDFVDGTTLRDELATHEGPQKLERIQEILGALCPALSYAHTQNVYHCDIKPENILISRMGKILLSDFGIAHMARSTSTLIPTDKSSGAGTPHYMAPEQIRAGRLFPQTDIYALGVVLFEMLTGQRPFNGDKAPATGLKNLTAVQWEHLNFKPPAPSRLNPKISPQIDAVVLRCLEKDPAARYANPIDLLNAFRLAQTPGMKLERPPRTLPWTQWPAWVWKAAAGILTTGLMLAVLFRVIPGIVNPLPKTPTVQATQAPTSAPVQPASSLPACMTFVVPGIAGTQTQECVTAVTSRPDGKIQVNLRWAVTSITSTFGVNIRADTHNTNMYLTDDQGWRLDHIQTGGGADQDMTLHNGETKEGWFLFPAPAAGASAIYFHDDDNQGVTPRIALPSP